MTGHGAKFERKMEAAITALLARPSIEDAARVGTNLMPVICSAVEALATVGEISDALRGVFGEYQESVVL